ncbi:MAG: hypothetical protein H6Q39_241 [Chloroflexi bacterium]|jgi:hypothetical protein|nr:hypothetical protein [Chloroflexota bacterium]
MLCKICLGIFFVSFIVFIIEGLALEKNMDSLIILVVTGIIMMSAILTLEMADQGRKRLES